jgi:hypothetical protein
MASRESDARFYQTFLAEREEIARYKWIESQKAGRDIGFEVALVDWAEHHRALWRRGQHTQEKAQST